MFTVTKILVKNKGAISKDCQQNSLQNHVLFKNAYFVPYPLSTTLHIYFYVL